MPTFKCTNQECKNFGYPIFFSHLKYIWNNDLMISKPRSSDIECKECKQEMIEEKKVQEGDISFYYGSFNTKSDEEKKTILKKRSSEHTRTKLKDRTQHIRKKFGLIK